jgi:hypothetical protein
MEYATEIFDPSQDLMMQLEDMAQAFNLTATSYGLQPAV